MNTRWSKEEENLLAKVWVEVSQDIVNGNEYSFWNQVVDMYNNQSNGDNSNTNIVTGKWTRLNGDCQKFNAIYKHLQRRSGENDSDYLENSKTIFEQRFGGRSFQYVHVTTGKFENLN